MKKKFLDMFTFHNMNFEKFDEIKDDIYELNRKNLAIFSFVSAVFLLAMAIVSFFVDRAAVNRELYCIMFVVMLAIVFYSDVLYKKLRKAMLPCVYLFMAVLFGFGIILATTGPGLNETCSSLIALILAVPLLFTDKPLRMSCAILLGAAAYIIVASRLKEASLFVTDFINVIIYSCISCIISSYMMQVKTDSIIFRKKSSYLAENDVLTGVKNRNCYELRMQSYADECNESVTCVYIDVNGLHQLNNTEGHKAGDEMLRYIAECIREQFDMEDIYRVGGDEYVILLKDADVKDVNIKLTQINKAVEQKNYNIAVGLEQSSKSFCEMESLVRAAEEKMFAEKDEYYRQAGVNR